MINLLQVVDNVVSILPNLSSLLYIISLLMGILFVWLGIKAVAKRQEMGRNAGSWSGPITTIAIGAAFVALPGLQETLTTTFFATSESPEPSAIFAYSPSTIGMLDAESPGGKLLEGIVAIVMFMGVIAIFRGLLMLNQAAQGGGGPKTLGPGMTFCIAGAMAINFPLFVGAMEWFITNSST